MIHLVCALPAEARPVIIEYGLERNHASRMFPVYIDSKGRLSLTVSGTDKVLASAAVAHTNILFHANHGSAWINFGIAGHASMHPGEMVLANKVIDPANGHSWYPQILFKHHFITDSIISLDKPTSDYPEKGLVDMEAAGFYAAACRTGLLELIHCIKIVSDNNEHPVSKINADYVTGLVRDKLYLFDLLIKQLEMLANSISASDIDKGIYDDLILKWHFTATQKNQLKELLRRQVVLLPDMTLPGQLINCKDGRDVIRALSKKLDNAPVEFES